MTAIMKFARSCSRLGLFGLCALIAFGGPSRIDAQGLQHIKIAVLPSDSVSLAYYAMERGTFKRLGLDAELIPLQSGPAIAAAVASGAADFGAANIIALAVAHEKGLPFVAIAPAGVYTSRSVTVGLVVAKSSTLKAAKELNGKIVAVDSLKTLATVAISSWSDRNGGDSTSLRFIELPFGQMGSALAAGRVDAAFVPEPLLSGVLASDGRLLAAPLDAIAPEIQLGAWFTTPDYVKAHADVVRKFVAAMAESATWSLANKAATGPIFEKYTKIPISDRTQRMLQSDKVDIAKVQPLIDAAAKYGALKQTIPAIELYAPGTAIVGK